MTLPAIRPAVMDDAAALARLSGELGYATAVSTMCERLQTLQADARYCLRVAEHPVHGVVGWVSAQRGLTLESGDLYEITGLVVSASQRQQGIGKRLVEAAQAWADAQGATKMRVRSNIRRAESHPFYQSLGYVLDKTQHVYSKPLHARPVPPKR